jgi:hypothetical protein
MTLSRVLASIGVFLAALVVVAILVPLDAAGARRQETAAPRTSPAEAKAQGIAPEPAGYLAFHVCDSEARRSLRATLRVESVEEGRFGPVIYTSDEKGRFNLELPQGHYLLMFCVPGYPQWRTNSVTNPHPARPVEIRMMSGCEPRELRPELINPKLRDGFTLIHGYMVDEETGQPLEGVRVRARKAGLEGRTNNRGYHAFSIPTPPTERERGFDFPGMDDLIVEYSGYKTYIGRSIDMVSGDWAMLDLDLQRGEGTIEHDHTHKLRRRDPFPEEVQAPDPSPTPYVMPARLKDWTYTPASACPLRSGRVPAVFHAIGIERPKIVVRGSNLAKVEIWAVPLGKEDKPEGYELIGSPSVWGTRGPCEIWPLEIPWWLNSREPKFDRHSQPLLAVEIFAKAFDSEGNLLATKSLPYKGVAALTEALRGTGELPPYSTLYTLRAEDSGERLLYSLGTTFDILLDEKTHPPAELDCSPTGALWQVPNVPTIFDGFTTLRYEAVDIGACTFRNRDFEVEVRVQ